MEKYLTDEKTGLRYELAGDYYILCGDEEEKPQPIGVWGKRHLRYIQENNKPLYRELQMQNRLYRYLAELDKTADDFFFELVNKLAQKENVTERLKAENQMLWVQKMNNIRNRAEEITLNEYIFC